MAAAVLLLAACETPPRAAIPQQSFVDRPPIAIDVAQIRIVDAYQPAMTPPHVEHLMAQAPADILRLWGQQRLQAAGSAGELLVVIEEASIVEEALASSPGLTGLFSNEATDRYAAHFVLRVDAVRAAWQGSAEASARRSITVLENATLAEREGTLFNLTERTVRDLDAELERNIRLHLGQFVID